MGPNGLSLHKPVVSGPGVGPGGIPISAGRSKAHNVARASPGLSKITSSSPSARKPSPVDASLEQSMI